MITEIDPERMYSFGEACRMIPTVHGGTLNLKTLHRWRLAGHFAAVARPSPYGRRWWFVSGAELLRLCMAETRPQFAGRTPARRAGDVAAARREAVRMGLITE